MSKLKTYEIVHPLGTTVQVQGKAVMTNVESGQTVIYASPDVVFNNIVAVVPSTCLIYEVYKSNV